MVGAEEVRPPEHGEENVPFAAHVRQTRAAGISHGEPRRDSGRTEVRAGAGGLLLAAGGGGFAVEDVRHGRWWQATDHSKRIVLFP
jgi:hypothetical protein